MWIIPSFSLEEPLSWKRLASYQHSMVRIYFTVRTQEAELPKSELGNKQIWEQAKTMIKAVNFL
jgi:hypothetical protein